MIRCTSFNFYTKEITWHITLKAVKTRNAERQTGEMPLNTYLFWRLTGLTKTSSADWEQSPIRAAFGKETIHVKRCPWPASRTFHEFNITQQPIILKSVVKYSTVVPRIMTLICSTPVVVPIEMNWNIITPPTHTNPPAELFSGF